MCMCAEYAIGNFRENHRHKDLEEAPEQENDYDQSDTRKRSVLSFIVSSISAMLIESETKRTHLF